MSDQADCVWRELSVQTYCTVYTKTKNREKRAEEKNPPTTHTYWFYLSIVGCSEENKYNFAYFANFAFAYSIQLQ